MRGHRLDSETPQFLCEAYCGQTIESASMSKRRDDAIRQEMIGILDALEIGLAEFGRIFRGVELGAPLDPQRARQLRAQCGELLTHIIETRNVIRLSATSDGIQLRSVSVRKPRTASAWAWWDGPPAAYASTLLICGLWVRFPPGSPRLAWLDVVSSGDSQTLRLRPSASPFGCERPRRCRFLPGSPFQP